MAQNQGFNKKSRLKEICRTPGVDEMQDGMFLVVYNCKSVPCHQPDCEVTMEFTFEIGTLQSTCNGGCNPINHSVNVKNATERIVLVSKISPELGIHYVNEFDCYDQTSTDRNWTYEITNQSIQDLEDFHVVLREAGSCYTRLSNVKLTNQSGTIMDPSFPLTLPGICEESANLIYFNISSLPGGASLTLNFESSRCPEFVDYCQAAMQSNTWRIFVVSQCDNQGFIDNPPNVNGTGLSTTTIPLTDNPNLIDVQYDCRNDAPTHCSQGWRQGIGGNLDDLRNYSYNIFPFSLSSNSYGDYCWNQGKAPSTYTLELQGEGRPLNSLFPMFRDEFGLTDVNENKLLLRARVNFSEGLALNTYPKLISLADQNLDIEPSRAWRFNEQSNATELCDVSSNLVDFNCNQTLNSGINCPNGTQNTSGTIIGCNCPGQSNVSNVLDCEAYGQSWYTYYEIDLDGTISDLDIVNNGLLTFEILSDCACFSGSAAGNSDLQALRPFEVQLDITPYRVVDFNDNSMVNSCIDLNDPNLQFNDLESLDWLKLGQIGFIDDANPDVTDVIGDPDSEDCGQMLDLNIQCPGCVTPGAIATNYSMERTNIGIYDGLNDGQIDDCNYSMTIPPQNTPFATNRSIIGDNLQDNMEVIFQDGDYNMGGYKYVDLTNQQKYFTSLQVRRDIGSLKTEFGLAMRSIKIQIRRGNNIILTRNFSNLDSFWTTMVQEDNEFFFLTFETGGDVMMGQLGNVGASLYQFQVEDVIYIECNYDVCGNKPITAPFNNLTLSDYFHEASIKNLAWFTGIPQGLNAWDAQGNVTGSSTPSTCHLTTTTDPDNCIYWCEATDGSHFFVSVGMFFSDIGQNSIADGCDISNCPANSCSRVLTQNIHSYIGDGNQDMFPYELRSNPYEVKELFNLSPFVVDGWNIDQILATTSNTDCSSGIPISTTSIPANLNLELGFNSGNLSCQWAQINDNSSVTQVQIWYTPDLNSNEDFCPNQLLTPQLWNYSAVYEIGLVNLPSGQVDHGSSLD